MAGNKRYVTIGPLQMPLEIANIIFLIVTVVAQVGQNVSLPLWLDSAAVNMTAVNMKHNKSHIGEVLYNPSTNSRFDDTSPSYDFDDYDDSTNHSNHSTPGNGTRHDVILSVDAYFVYSFACISFVVIFGVITLLIKLLSPESIGETERTFPQFQLFLVGFSDALNGVLVVFAAPPSRTSPLLQSILGNFTIPMTVAIR